MTCAPSEDSDQPKHLPGYPGRIPRLIFAGRTGSFVGFVVLRLIFMLHHPMYSAKIRFIEKPGVQDEGVRHVAKRSSDPRVAYPEVNVQVRDLVRVVGIVALFAQRGFSIRGKFVLSIGQAKSSIPALSYCQVGGMKHDQELYAKVSYKPTA